MDINFFNEHRIPLIGIGPGGVRYDVMKKTLPWPISVLTNKYKLNKVRKDYVSSIASALSTGFRLIDYSPSYGNGSLLHLGIEKSGIKRDQLFISTRVSNPAQLEKRVREELLSFLLSMQLDYVDLLQIHWPVTNLYLDTWREMEKLKEEGLVRHLGVANCHRHHLEEIFSICKYQPEVGQFEIHPLFTQKSLIEFYKQHEIIVEAYTPLARNDDRLVRIPLLKKMETRYKKTYAQIILRWHVQNGCIPLVRSMNPQHQQEDFDIFDFELSSEDMEAIDGLNINSRLRYDPDNCDFSIL